MTTNKICLVLLGAIAYAHAASLDTCAVGSWSDWSDCTSSKHCPAVPLPVSSYPMQESAEWDTGRAHMKIIMEHKQQKLLKHQECLRSGTCPELALRPSEGEFPCVLGSAGDIPCLNVDQLSFVNFVNLGYGNPLPGDNAPEGNDCWGWIDPTNGDEYAIMGLTGGTSFVRITDPVNPVPVGFIYSATTSSVWRDIKVIGDYAYIVSEASGHGLQVFDLTRLRGRETVEYFTPDAVNKDFGNAHNIVANVDTNYLYVVGATQSSYPRICRGGLLVIDVRNPLTPTTVGCFGDDGYVHDAQCVTYHGPDARYTGREICFSFNEDSLTIVDVTDKEAMTMIAKSGYVNVGYTHQGWVTEDHEVLLLDDEFDETDGPSSFTKTYVWDVTTLTNPTLRSIYESDQTSIDHNQYIKGDYVFQGNYESGLRILHINRETYQLSTVAYFDIYPTRTQPEFNGAWSVFPYFPSGQIIISTFDYGLFVVKADWAAIEALVQSETTYAQQTRSRPVISNSSGATCPALVETKTCAAPVLC